VHHTCQPLGATIFIYDTGSLQTVMQTISGNAALMGVAVVDRGCRGAEALMRGIGGKAPDASSKGGNLWCVSNRRTVGQDSIRRHAFGRGAPRGAVGPSLARMSLATYNRALTVFCLATGGVWTRPGNTHHRASCLPCFLQTGRKDRGLALPCRTATDKHAKPYSDKRLRTPADKPAGKWHSEPFSE
jgi:hypothetical protein